MSKKLWQRIVDDSEFDEKIVKTFIIEYERSLRYFLTHFKEYPPIIEEVGFGAFKVSFKKLLFVANRNIDDKKNLDFIKFVVDYINTNRKVIRSKYLIKQTELFLERVEQINENEFFQITFNN